MDAISVSGSEYRPPMDYLNEGETDLLGVLPDYHKMKLADVDVIERTVTKCRPRNPTKVKKYKWKESLQGVNDTSEECEQESEELDSQLMDMDMEEDASTDEQTPAIQTLMALDSLLRRIEILQCDIRLRQQLEGNIESQSEDLDPKPEEDVCQGLPLQLLEIRQLQRAQHQLQCEITELLCRYANLRTQKRALSHQWNRVVQKTSQLRMVSREHHKWMQDTAHEMGNCRKRSRAIKAGKLTKELADEVTETNIWSSFRYSRRYLLRRLVGRHIEDLRCEIKELKQYSHDLATEINGRLASINEKAVKLGRLTRASGATGNQTLTSEAAPRKKPSILSRNPKYKAKNPKKF